ncbi:hypothetical protein GCM10009830_09610 [Glycomyces endophyticus]|uniref:DUF4345 domain-containing protein n=1 Tax=Glycomyces endophyticus TaxID=480996 RepID=A0ABN2G7F3_9ACTN
MSILTEAAAPQRLSYLTVVRASAAYDLVVTAGFATPWTFALVHAGLNALSGALGLDAFPGLDPMQILYANLMGSVVVVWSLLRLARPQRLHGLLDAAARVLFSLWMAYALASGGPDLLWPFLIVEVSWGAIQLAPWLSARSRPRA